MNENEKELDRILKENPFLKKIEQWRRKLEELANADLETIQRNYFILDGDEQFLDEKYKKKDTRLYLDLFPQPFIGNPKADIWYVQINPSFSWVDYYDLISINNDLIGDIRRGLVCQVEKRGITENDFVFTAEANALESQRRRRELLLNQLDLCRTSHEFYVLDESFHTVEYGGTSKVFGSYRWWRKAFCMNRDDAIFFDVFHGSQSIPEVLGDKFFVIEFFPYHSAKFDRRYNYPSHHPYRKFVIEMLRYAVKTGKTILFRTKHDYETVGMELLGGNCTASSNPNSVWLTKNCFHCFNSTGNVSGS